MNFPLAANVEGGIEFIGEPPKPRLLCFAPYQCNNAATKKKSLALSAGN